MLIVKIVVFILFVPMPLFGVYAAIRAWRLVRHGVRVRARLLETRTTRPHHSEFDDQVDYVFEFVDLDGRIRRGTLPMAYNLKSPVVDNHLPIIFRRDDPRIYDHAHWLRIWITPIAMFAPAIALAIWLGAQIAWHRWFGP